mmetsp:Transcript_6499/g.15860  ORF Transcript_6499/g.15860 Transcript_6499/m.15860 type:complete len:283 (+) Transcript_6499:56-904(+)
MAASARGAKLTGALSTIAQRRITKEKAQLEKEHETIAECGIYVHWTDELHKPLALIIGPAGTPYEGGFYFFDVQFTDDYPMTPPRVLFRTGDGRVRFNPNLYVDGKVCLSILGTWDGPSWSTSGQLRTVLVSIQSLLSSHPIQNEPGHERECGKQDELYSDIIRYENIAVAVVRMLENTPAGFERFRPQMRKVFLQRFDSYVAVLESYKKKEQTTVRSPIWSFIVKFSPKEVSKQLLALQQKLLAEESHERCTSPSSRNSEQDEPDSSGDTGLKKRRTVDKA